jgi:hypothetical protein
VGNAGVVPPALNAQVIGPLVPFQPVTQRGFSATDTVLLFGRAFWKSKTAPTLRAAMLSIPSSGVAMALSVLAPVGSVSQGTFQAALPLRGLPPGPQVIEVTSRSADGMDVVKQIPITIK